MGGSRCRDVGATPSGVVERHQDWVMSRVPHGGLSMSRQSFVTVAFLGLALLRGATAFGDESKPKAYYFTTLVGDRSVFTVTSQGMTTEAVEEVTSISSKDGIVLVETKHTSGDGTRRGMTHEVSDKGVYHVATNSEFLASRRSVLSLPAKKGDTWQVKLPSKAEETATSGTAIVVDTDEELVVPAGRFRCVHVQTSFKISAYSARMSVWLTPGIGVVRTVMETGESPDRLQAIMDMTLKSFTSGKK